MYYWILKLHNFLFGFCDECNPASKMRNNIVSGFDPEKITESSDSHSKSVYDITTLNNLTVSDSHVNASNNSMTDDRSNKYEIEKKFVLENYEQFTDVLVDVENKSPMFLPYSIVIHNMRIISKLVPYQKLCVDNNKLALDTSLIQSYSRWRNGQSKEITIPKIMETIKCATQILPDKNYSDNQHEELTRLLDQSIKGLRNLLITYPTKSDQIGAIIANIRDSVRKTE